MGTRGVNAKSLENLRRGNPATQFNGRYAVDMARKSVEARRQYASFREAAREVLTEEVMLSILRAMVDQAMTGNVRAFEVLRDTVDGKPVKSVELTNGIGSDPVQFVLTVVDEKTGKTIDMDEITG